MFDITFAGLNASQWIINAIVVAVTLGIAGVFLLPRVRSSSVWRATVTPLASIIGSGFLVVAPLLGFTAGRWALVAMAGIVALAYLVGSAVRYNIRHVEDIIESDTAGTDVEKSLRWMGRIAKLALAIAYVIAVTFYLELLGAFVLRVFGIENQIYQKVIASALIIVIGAFGAWKGLRSLESLERYAVETKLAIIGAFLIALFVFNGELVARGSWSLPSISASWDVVTIRKLLGAFLVVQGFETSRYLRGVYEPEHRIRTMRYAQLGAAGVYILFVGLATVLLDVFDRVSETGIITLSSQVAFTLPILLSLGAVMSQFSAAVADTVGSGGLAEEFTNGRVSRRLAYPAVGVLSLALLWSTNIFAVIAFASRAFALYYAMQCAMSVIHAASNGKRSLPKALYFGLLTLLMIAVAVLGIPAESSGGS